MLCLNDGESSQLITPLTTQTLSFIGAANEGTNLPTFVSNNYASAPTVPANLQNAISNIDAQLFATETAASAHISSTSGVHGFTNIATHDHTGVIDGLGRTTGAKIPHATGLTYTSATDDLHTIYVKADGTRAFTGKVQGVSTAGGDPGTTLATKDYVLSTVPSLAHVTYDNVAETISSRWTFQDGLVCSSGGTLPDLEDGAQIDRIRIRDDGIYESDTAGWVHLDINKHGYDGGISYSRSCSIYNGRRDVALEAGAEDINGGTKVDLWGRNIIGMATSCINVESAGGVKWVGGDSGVTRRVTKKSFSVFYSSATGLYTLFETASMYQYSGSYWIGHFTAHMGNHKFGAYTIGRYWQGLVIFYNYSGVITVSMPLPTTWGDIGAPTGTMAINYNVVTRQISVTYNKTDTYQSVLGFVEYTTAGVSFPA